MIKMISSFMDCDLTLRKGFAELEGSLMKSCSSCVYLRPIADQDLSIEKPHSTVQ